MASIIRILHVTSDDKFFDAVFAAWDNYKLFENKAVLITNRRLERYKYIKNPEKLHQLWNKRMVKEYFKSNNYDIVYFYSLPFSWYPLINYIPKNRIIIWWSWGYDLYYPKKWLSPLIKLDIIKPLTKKYISQSNYYPHKIIFKLFWLAILPVMKKMRIDMLKRIDYFQPVVKKEYELMSEHMYFRAKEFYAPDSFSWNNLKIQKKPEGDILLGNSATPSNNHLDVLNILKGKKKDSQKIIMPLSYGNNYYKKWLEARLADFNIFTIVDFMPQNDYFKLLDTCSYAIFGTIRQQSLGNISYALSTGIKVFLYKDSIVYQDFVELGFIVFAIEDMTTESLSTPLTESEFHQNKEAALHEQRRRNEIFIKTIKEIEVQK